MILMNLFSVFDPCSYFGASLNWVILLLLLIFLPMKYYLVSSHNLSFFVNLLGGVDKMFCEIASSQYLGAVFVSVVTFIYLILNNVLGLFPFIFTGTAHPIVTMGLGMVFWVAFFFMGVFKNFSMSAAHLVPEGSPLFLSPVMVLIESISHLMRPFTLSIRLAANMMAGHLIVSLLASISLVSILGFSASLVLQGVLLILEVGVSVIQGFVFSILVLLYCLEYY